ncbi:MAG: hypothetical protein PHG02_08000 [Oscillospiraceae bacterium]|nr:hypothetical protein [Oscillospiraceae bacterium]
MPQRACAKASLVVGKLTVCPFIRTTPNQFTKGHFMKKQTKLYNLIFPVWLLWLIPITWLVILPANFIIDLTVILLTLRHLKVDEIKKKAKSVILKTWIFGFVADFIGTVGMFLASVIDFDFNTPIGKWWYQNISNAVSYNPFSSVWGFLWVTVCVIITALFIYLFNYKICFKKLDLSPPQKKALALSMAVFTAPYVFYLPTAWFF